MTTDTTTRPPRVLLVDDQPRLLALLAPLLTDHGMTVVGTAGDGTQVLPAIDHAVAGHGAVDVVLMDERMPNMNGLEATRLVRTVFPDVAVVLYTAFAGQLGDAPSRAGVTAEVAKGGHPQELVQAVQRACHLARSGRVRAPGQPC